MMLSGKLGLTLFVDDANWPCYSGDHTGQVSIYNMTGGGGYADGFSINLPSIGYHTLEKSLSDLYLTAGNEYKFVLEFHDAKATLGLSYIPSVTNVICGGLRLKQIKTHDGISSTNDIIRTFEYTMEGSSISSGRITNKPRYGYLVNDWTALFTSTGLLPLSNAHGSHITYIRMKEVYDGNGYTEYKVYNKEFSYSPSYPPKSIPFDAIDGIVKEVNNYDEDNELVSEISTVEGSSLLLNIAGVKYNVAKVKVYLGSMVLNKTLVTSISEQTNIYRPANSTQISDGISNTVFYEYHDQNSILSPVKVSSTNSNGKTTDVFTQYTVDYHLDSNIKDGLIERHMIGIPYETTNEVNGTQLNGSRTQYAYFTSSGYYTSSISTSNFPRPYYNQLYERTWTNGSLTSGVWITTDSLLKYTSDGLLSTYKKSNWPSVEYDYNGNKLITSIEYEDHTKSYIYYTNTGVLYKSIDIDDTDLIYTYDGLMRTKFIEDICKGTSTHYEYYFAPYSYERSYIKTTTTFPDTIPSLSDLTSLEEYAYLDGLGRTVQTVRKGQAPNGHDIVQAVAYDNRGRAHKQYETQSNNGSGSYHAPQGGWEFTLTEYEPSPLSRVVKVTPLGGMGPVEYSYGHNTTDDEVLVLPSPFIWPEKKLFKKTVKDGNGNLSISFTDLKGRVLMTRRTDSLESTAKNLDTYTLYDDKDRVSKVLPPGSETTTTDLIYEYEYNGRDQLVKKYIPGAEMTEYIYNDRHQLGGYRDGYLRDHGKSYTYT